MAVITFTAADILQTKVVPADIYPTEITNIESKKSTSGKSINHVVDFEIIDGQYKGKGVTLMFSTGVKSPTMLGSMQFFPVQTFLEIETSITGKEHKAENGPYSLDTDTLLHHPLDCAWDIHTIEGNIINIIKAFHPRGYASSAPAF